LATARRAALRARVCAAPCYFPLRAVVAATAVGTGAGGHGSGSVHASAGGQVYRQMKEYMG